MGRGLAKLRSWATAQLTAALGSLVALRPVGWGGAAGPPGMSFRAVATLSPRADLRWPFLDTQSREEAPAHPAPAGTFRKGSVPAGVRSPCPHGTLARGAAPRPSSPGGPSAPAGGSLATLPCPQAVLGLAVGWGGVSFSKLDVFQAPREPTGPGLICPRRHPGFSAPHAQSRPHLPPAAPRFLCTPRPVQASSAPGGTQVSLHPTPSPGLICPRRHPGFSAPHAQSRPHLPPAAPRFLCTPRPVQASSAPGGTQVSLHPTPSPGLICPRRHPGFSAPHAQSRPHLPPAAPRFLCTPRPVQASSAPGGTQVSLYPTPSPGLICPQRHPGFSAPHTQSALLAAGSRGSRLSLLLPVPPGCPCYQADPSVAPGPSGPPARVQPARLT
nr:proline-rich protein HaeIII subfamily 1-like [Oryctolagus cuniculus]